ncbi:MAG: hypothetical protein QOE25_1261 [Actinomycetota bacterium]|nr:hypothetical protein [Actinomycetota bacterium]
MKHIRIGVLALAALFLLPSAAVAQQPVGDVADGNDSPGLLDISHFYGVKTVSDGPLTIRIHFFENVKSSMFTKSSKDKVSVYFDASPNYDGVADYTGIVRQTNSGDLEFLISGSGSSFDPLKVTRPNRRELKTIVPGNSPPNPNGPLEIKVKTVYVSTSGACASGCQDRAPDSGWLLT